MIFSDIESYIEFIGGYRDRTGKQVSYWATDPVIALASYDVGFVTSVAESTIIHSVPMSHRQAELSEKLIAKYEKQLTNLGISQPGHTNYRLGKREVVHVNSLTLSGDSMFFRFKFNDKTIADVKAFVKESQGRVNWSKDEKAWVFGLTEYNVSWAVAYAQANGISVSDEVKELFDLIVEAEANPKLIELQLVDGKLVIQNAPDSLNEYIAENIGFDDIYTLIDSAGVLAYAISPEILNLISSEHGEVFAKLLANRYIEMQNNVPEILKWAKSVNRLPICVYNPNILNFDLTQFLDEFTEDEIQIIDMKNHTNTVDTTKKLVYTNKVIEWPGRLPLLITYSNLMHGAPKKAFADRAEKTVLCCPPLLKR